MLLGYTLVCLLFCALEEVTPMWASAPAAQGGLQLSEQQRVAVARALVMRPTLLLADEPTGDLDETTAESLHALLREMHAACGLTSIVATHNQRLAAACDRVLRLEGGRLHDNLGRHP